MPSSWRRDGRRCTRRPTLRYVAINKPAGALARSDNFTARRGGRRSDSFIFVLSARKTRYFIPRAKPTTSARLCAAPVRRIRRPGTSRTGIGTRVPPTALYAHGLRIYYTAGVFSRCPCDTAVLQQLSSATYLCARARAAGRSCTYNGRPAGRKAVVPESERP